MPNERTEGIAWFRRQHERWMTLWTGGRCSKCEVNWRGGFFSQGTTWCNDCAIANLRAQYAVVRREQRERKHQRRVSAYREAIRLEREEGEKNDSR